MGLAKPRSRPRCQDEPLVSHLEKLGSDARVAEEPFLEFEQHAVDRAQQLRI